MQSTTYIQHCNTYTERWNVENHGFTMFFNTNRLYWKKSLLYTNDLTEPMFCTVFYLSEKLHMTVGKCPCCSVTILYNWTIETDVTQDHVIDIIDSTILLQPWLILIIHQKQIIISAMAPLWLSVLHKNSPKPKFILLRSS